LVRSGNNVAGGAPTKLFIYINSVGESINVAFPRIGLKLPGLIF
jgi:hypothetical protein